MKAKCPHCVHGCEKCENGFIQVKLATGPVFTRKCQTCGGENGCYILMDSLPRTAEGKPIPPPGDCVWCNAPCEWLQVGEIE